MEGVLDITVGGQTPSVMVLVEQGKIIGFTRRALIDAVAQHHRAYIGYDETIVQALAIYSLLGDQDVESCFGSKVPREILLTAPLKFLWGRGVDVAPNDQARRYSSRRDRLETSDGLERGGETRLLRVEDRLDDENLSRCGDQSAERSCIVGRCPGNGAAPGHLPERIRRLEIIIAQHECRSFSTRRRDDRVKGVAGMRSKCIVEPRGCRIPCSRTAAGRTVMEIADKRFHTLTLVLIVASERIPYHALPLGRQACRYAPVTDAECVRDESALSAGDPTGHGGRVQRELVEHDLGPLVLEKLFDPFLEKPLGPAVNELTLARNTEWGESDTLHFRGLFISLRDLYVDHRDIVRL
jgi:hypothetical protein